jgi:hypothetical protein
MSLVILFLFLINCTMSFKIKIFLPWCIFLLLLCLDYDFDW